MKNSVSCCSWIEFKLFSLTHKVLNDPACTVLYPSQVQLFPSLTLLQISYPFSPPQYLARLSSQHGRYAFYHVLVSFSCNTLPQFFELLAYSYHLDLTSNFIFSWRFFHDLLSSFYLWSFPSHQPISFIKELFIS